MRRITHARSGRLTNASDVAASALEEPIMNRYNTVIKQSPPYRRLVGKPRDVRWSCGVMWGKTKATT